MRGTFTDDLVRLWRAVVLQALLDAGNLGIASMYPTWPTYRIKMIRDEARKWIKKADQDFVDVCDLANLDSDVIRRFGMKVIRGDTQAKHRLLEWKNYFRKPQRGYRDNGRADNTNFNSDR
jgi:hypothetical protein